MIILLKPDPTGAVLKQVQTALSKSGIQANILFSCRETLLEIPELPDGRDPAFISALPGVASVIRTAEKIALWSREAHPENTCIRVKKAVFGDGSFPVIAGPCAVETQELMNETARAVYIAGAAALRGGAFKPRTSPYDFQGLGREGLELLIRAGKENGLPVVSEIMSLKQLPLFEDVDILQVGARNMQNFELLKELGHLHKPILLKRGLAATLQELLMSTEYILAGGNTQVILCERGIRGCSGQTRNVLDLSAIPMLHRMTHLPVIVDPSHATGIADLVAPMAAAAAACGADGLMLEVHPHPEKALCDGAQAIHPDTLEKIIRTAKAVRTAVGYSAE